MAPSRRNARGFTDPLRPCGPSLRPPQGPDGHFRKSVTLRQGDAAARAVIGPLTKTRRGTETGSRLRRSDCVVVASRRRGTVISPFGTLGGVKGQDL